MKTKGLVSVIMGVHNEKEQFLRTAIESILQQTYPLIELIVIDDASNKECQVVLTDICKRNENVQVFRNECNLGLTKSLNRGLTLAKGEYIARMDADDYSLPDRIEKQVIFLRNNSDIDIVGTGVVSFGAVSRFESPAFGYNNNEAQCNLFFSSTLCHPSVMIRSCFLENNQLQYDEKVRTGQDYDLWERSSVRGRLAVMPEVLLFYRTHSSQITSTCNASQQQTSAMVQKRRLNRLGLNPTEREFICHQLLAHGSNHDVKVGEVRMWVEKILKANAETSLVNQNELRNNLCERLFLFKVRNSVGLSYFTIQDALILLKMITSRIKTQIKLLSTQSKIKKDI